MMITVRYFAGARAAAGVSEETFPSGTRLDQIAGDRGHLGKVLLSASFLVDGLAWHDRSVPLPAGVTVDVLPPFAGG
ncbi:MoaD/ThiS family protein [Catelliglobosispora koreensis]|uniref:MoaD/ThiS family protein n=1 Tax=Catelliglobosispora koreensis TaxID=129052 RepID=UPI00058EDCC3|nr:MoaD/ThiS family protein [Catelliglobosispora koreensis]